MGIKIWLQTEYKRAAAVLPFALIKAAILVMIVSMTAFCALELVSSGKMQQVRIGYSAPEDEITTLALSYMKKMDSLEGWCTLVPVSEEEGIVKLREGELAALMVLPDNMVESIIDGTNEPARLYLANDSRIAGYVFEELANAGVGMLRTAQAEIYATYDIVADMGIDASILPELTQQIDRHNLQLVMNREQLYKVRRLSVTGNDGRTVYYVSALFTIYMLLAGLYLGKYCVRTQQEEQMTDCRLGIPYIVQLIGRVLITVQLLILLLLLPCLLWLIPAIREDIALAVTWKGILALTLVLVCAALYIQCIYSAVRQSRTVLLVTGMSVLIQGYISGCFWPTALLPQVVGQLSGFIPATYIKSAFTILLTGESRQYAHICTGLLCWILIMGAVCLILMKKQDKNKYRINRSRSTHTAGSSLFMVLYRRLLHKKSFWLCLSLTMVVSFVLAGMEKKSDTVINAAFYDEKGTYEELLENYQGIVQFASCDTREEVQRLVLAGKAECGYCLPDDLEDRLNSEDIQPVIQVWESEDGFYSDVVNEVLFEQVYTSSAFNWYKDYMVSDVVLADTYCISMEANKALKERMEDGSTFYFERQVVQPSQAEDEKTSYTYPVWLVVTLQMVLCGAVGIAQAVGDCRMHRFYKRHRVATLLITVIQPVLMAGFAGILILTITKIFL